MKLLNGNSKYYSQCPLTTATNSGWRKSANRKARAKKMSNSVVLQECIMHMELGHRSICRTIQ